MSSQPTFPSKGTVSKAAWQLARVLMNGRRSLLTSEGRKSRLGVVKLLERELLAFELYRVLERVSIWGLYQPGSWSNKRHARNYMKLRAQIENLVKRRRDKENAAWDKIWPPTTRPTSPR